MIHTVTATEMQNNFGRYANIVLNGGHVLVTRNGKVFGQFIPANASETPITDSLRGILSGHYDLKQTRDERLRNQYEADD